MQKIIAFLLLLSGPAAGIFCQPSKPFRPAHEEMLQRYKRAAAIDSMTKNAVFKTTVNAHWQPSGESFWYMNLLADSVQEYMLVNAADKLKKPLFNRERLARGLQGAGIAIDPLRPSLTNIETGTAGAIAFEVQGKKVLCKIPSYECSIQGNAAKEKTAEERRGWGSRDFPEGAASPDKKWLAYLEGGNLFVRPAAGGRPLRFTWDGAPERPYGTIRWSPDSRYLAGYHIYPVKDDTVYYVLSSVPGTSRGQLRYQQYKQPGDPWTKYEPWVFSMEKEAAVKVKADAVDFLYAPQQHWRTTNPRYFVYEKTDRGHQRFRIIEVDALNGNTRELVDEKVSSFIYDQRNYTHYLEKSGQLLRTSEKSGWRQLYMVNMASGKEQPVTNGNWVLRNVDSVSEQGKQVWFTACGVNSGEDPYNIHYYRINFDGTGMTDLTPAAGNHKLSFSPGKKYFLDTWSTVNTPPQTTLCSTASAAKLLDVEQADLSLYKLSSVRPPEVFVAKARDGKTDIWGIVSRPSDFDSTKLYPVLENIYAGPHDSFVPKDFTPYSEMQSLAELGFIVVMIDGMGTANRSKAFHDVCWLNLADAGFPDRILWIKDLAAKHPGIDTARVGIYGTSAGGQSTLGALLFHPEFYKAGVAACGCHDNRVDKQWWNEQWMGYPVGRHYADQSNVTNAGKLRGNLLLIVGEADTNVPPESTYRVADALIKAGKSFEFLPMPGMGHSDGGPYGRIRKRDFFVRHLLGAEPPNRNGGELATGEETGRERWNFR